MCGIYCVYKQSRSCQLLFCASPIFHFDFSVYMYDSHRVIMMYMSGSRFYIHTNMYDNLPVGNK